MRKWGRHVPPRDELYTSSVTLLKFLAGAAVARIVRLDLGLIALEGRVTNRFSGPRGGCSRHCTGESHSGCLSASSLIGETFKTLTLFLFIANNYLEIE